MPVDPFLNSHLIKHLWFHIGGPLAPISIRDQMFRGRVLVERMVKEGLISKDHPLLVIGAGAAGATAAIRAAQLNVTVHLVERGIEEFSVQGNCGTRWICPTQYDWPAAHWKEKTFPWLSLTETQLEWSANLATDIAIEWKKQLKEAKMKFADKDGRRLFVYKGLEITSGTVAQNSAGQYLFQITSQETPGIVVSSDSDDLATLPQKFGAVLSCFGFGRENTSPPEASGSKFCGPEFWSSDDLENHNCGIDAGNGGAGSPGVMISGGGDGALQDLLRVVFGKRSAEEIYSAILSEAEKRIPQQSAGEFREAVARMEAEIGVAEEQAFRLQHLISPVWSRESQRHLIFLELEVRHVDALDELDKKGFVTPLREAVLSLLRSDRPNVTFVYPCSHFTAHYGLNRFLTKLLQRSIYSLDKEAPVRKSIRIRPGFSVCDVQPVHPGHTCDKNNSYACCNIEHKVVYRNWNCKIAELPASERASKFKKGGIAGFRLVILRHGIKGFDGDTVYLYELGDKTNVAKALPWRLQMLPYHPADPPLDTIGD